MNDTIISVAGNVVGEIRTGTTGDGVPTTRFRMAVSRRWQDRGSGRWTSGPASFYGVACFRRLAENVGNSLERGDPVVVSGRLSVREWERDGRWYTSAEIEAFAVGHDLARGRTELVRPDRAGEADVVALPVRDPGEATPENSDAAWRHA